MKKRFHAIPRDYYHMSLEEIAAIENVSYQRIQEIIENAIKKLGRIIEKGVF